MNFFGEGIRFWTCDPTLPNWEPLNEFKLKHSLRWDQVLFDLSVLKKFGYSHWSELSVVKEQVGFVLNHQNRIELKKGAKFLEKFRADELYNDRTLFPRFQTEESSLDHLIDRPLFIFQFETGLIAKYIVESDHFQMDELRFTLTRPLMDQNDFLLTAILYKGICVPKIKEDSLVRGMRIIE